MGQHTPPMLPRREQGDPAKRESHRTLEIFGQKFVFMSHIFLFYMCFIKGNIAIIFWVVKSPRRFIHRTFTFIIYYHLPCLNVSNIHKYETKFQYCKGPQANEFYPLAIFSIPLCLFLFSGPYSLCLSTLTKMLHNIVTVISTMMNS